MWKLAEFIVLSVKQYCIKHEWQCFIRISNCQEERLLQEQWSIFDKIWDVWIANEALRVSSVWYTNIYLLNWNIQWSEIVKIYASYSKTSYPNLLHGWDFLWFKFIMNEFEKEVRIKKCHQVITVATTSLHRLMRLACFILLWNWSCSKIYLKRF